MRNLNALCLLLFISSAACAEPELIWKRTFESRIVKTSTLRDADFSKGRPAEFPIKAIMTEKSIHVLDNKGQTATQTSLAPYAKAVMSDDGSTMAGIRGREIIIAGVGGEAIGTVAISDPRPEIAPEHVVFELAPNGEYLVMISYLARAIYFYAGSGDMLAKHDFPDARGAEVRFSGDSRYAAIHLPNWGTGTTSGYLVFFDRQGKELWRFDHKGCEGGFDLSHDGSIVALAAEDKLFVLDEGGRAKCDAVCADGPKLVAVSALGRPVAVGTSANSSLSLFDAKNGRALWSNTIQVRGHEAGALILLRISANAERTAICATQRSSRHAGQVWLCIHDIAGKRRWSRTVERTRLGLSLSPSGSLVMLTAGSEGYLYVSI